MSMVLIWLPLVNAYHFLNYSLFITFIQALLTSQLNYSIRLPAAFPPLSIYTAY